MSHPKKSSQEIIAGDILSRFDGLLLPGGFSNIHPSFVGRAEPEDGDDYDILRDKTAIALVREAYEMDMPTLGICRGMQEMVAAYGGRLEKLENEQHAANYKYAGDFEKMDTPVHDITFVENGSLRDLFAGIYDASGRVRVNSIHYEGVTLEGVAHKQSKTMRQRFDIEAVSHDDVVEAISGKGRAFFIGLQAHFELKGPMHDRLFNAFVGHIARRFESRITQPATDFTFS